MNYRRVIPRDFFNEAKLLKCMGQLSLKILDGMLPDGVEVTIEDEKGKSFDIHQNDFDGCIFIKNYPTHVNGYPVVFKTILNSKAPYPLLVEIKSGKDSYYDLPVFDDDGNFTDEFKAIKYELPPKFTLKELQDLQTLEKFQFDNVKIANERCRVLLSRMTIANGAEYNNQVTVERLIDGCWKIADQYQAK